MVCAIIAVSSKAAKESDAVEKKEVKIIIPKTNKPDTGASTKVTAVNKKEESKLPLCKPGRRMKDCVTKQKKSKKSKKPKA